MPLTVAAALVGILFAGAVLTFTAAARRPRPDLAWALDNLSQTPTHTHTPHAAPETRLEQLGVWAAIRLGVGTTAVQRSQLRLRGISDLEFVGTRLVWAMGLGVLPLLVSVIMYIGGISSPLFLPPLVAVVGAVFGWFWPVLQLRQQASATIDDSAEALLVFIDLVVLERLANASAVDALTHAAFTSDNALFVQIQHALNRAALENVAPWRELESLAEAINLPQLNDVVAIARLQQEGASMANPLRARVAELRNAHLLKVRQENVRITARMEILQVLPVIAVMVVFIAAPMLALGLQT